MHRPFHPWLALFLCVVLGVLSFRALSNALSSTDSDPAASKSPLTIFTAKTIITMEPAMPRATAVAVQDGLIVAVGSLQSMQAWIDARGANIDRRFENNIIMPGFIDPHVHPSLPAILTQFPFLAPDDWSLPTGEFPGALTPQAYRESLQALVEKHFSQADYDKSVPFITWGYHPLWHGELYRQDLNALFPDQPVMLWHRSFHELIGNDKALELLGISEELVANLHEADWEKGHFWENGMAALIPSMSFLFAPERYVAGMQNFVEMLHMGGVTSVMDMGTGIFGNPAGEMALIRQVFERDTVPSRVVLTPIITDFLLREVAIDDALREIETWTQQNTDKVMLDGHFKLMMDGAIFSGLSQFAFPGYMDGHEGQWMAPLDVTYAWAEAFWNAGFQLHAHTNGDASTTALIDMVRKLQAQRPRVDHRTTLEHFAYATESQIAQMHALGMVVSANPYYQFILSDVYADQWLGEDRARNMVPLGAVERAGMRFGLHSDNPMAPLSPLTLAWAAVNRTTINGNSNNPLQRVTLDNAMRGITIDAAWLMGWEDKVGSIVAGKKADFAVLDKNPYKTRAKDLRDINVLATVYEGKPFPVRQDSQ